MSLDIETYAGYKMESGKLNGYAVVKKDNGFCVAGSMASMEVYKWNWTSAFSEDTLVQTMKNIYDKRLDMTNGDHKRWFELATAKMSVHPEKGAWESAELLCARYLMPRLTSVYECLDDMEGWFEKGVLYYGTYSGDMLLVEDMFGTKRYVLEDKFKRRDLGAYIEKRLGFK